MQSPSSNPQLPSASTVRTYAWGPDLSGTMQGAGGVSGLLGVSVISHTPISNPETRTYAACADANGNVMGLVNTSTGDLAARWDYDAFGNTVTDWAVEASDLCPFRFSTKYLDAETGWYYYGYRFYDPVNGRWPSRDPIEEKGGVNLYRMVGNDAVNQWDFVGLDDHHWFMRYGKSKFIGQQKIRQRFPRLCIDIDRYTTAIDGKNVGKYATGTPHIYVHHRLFGGLGYQKLYEDILAGSKDECQFLVNMYALMQVTHLLLKLEQELNGFTSGSYTAAYLDLHPYGGGQSTHLEYLLLTAAHCQGAGRQHSLLPEVVSQQRKTDDLIRKVQLIKWMRNNTPCNSLSCMGERPAGGYSQYSDEPTPLEDGIISIGEGLILGAVAVADDATIAGVADDAVALPLAAQKIGTGAGAVARQLSPRVIKWLTGSAVVGP